MLSKKHCKYHALLPRATNLVNTVFCCPEGLQKSARFWGLARIRAIINSSNDSKHFDVGVVTHCTRTQRRFYKQTTLGTVAFAQSSSYTEALMRRCSYTERFVQREAFTHRRLYIHSKRLLHTGAFTHWCFVQGCLCTAQHLRTVAFVHTHTQPLLLTDAFARTEAFTQRNLCTEQLLHKEVSLPPTKKTGKQVFELGFFFVSCRFPFRQWMLMDDTGISSYFCLSYGFPVSIP